jgi:hypothetical protein
MVAEVTAAPTPQRDERCHVVAIAGTSTDEWRWTHSRRAARHRGNQFVTVSYRSSVVEHGDVSGYVGE